MRSAGWSDAGAHSLPKLTWRPGPGTNGPTAATASWIEFRYSTPEAPGHCAEGSLETFVNGFPSTPLFVTFMNSLPAVSTWPGPTMSGSDVGAAGSRVAGTAMERSFDRATDAQVTTATSAPSQVRRHEPRRRSAMGSSRARLRRFSQPARRATRATSWRLGQASGEHLSRVCRKFSCGDDERG